MVMLMGFINQLITGRAHPVGKSSINDGFSIAMFDCRRVNEVSAVMARNTSYQWDFNPPATMAIYIYILKGLRPLPPTHRPLEAGKCLTLLSEATRKALGKRPECCKSLRRRRRGAFEARLLPPECSKSLWQGRREAFGGRQVPNVAF